MTTHTQSATKVIRDVALFFSGWWARSNVSIDVEMPGWVKVCRVFAEDIAVQVSNVGNANCAIRCLMGSLTHPPPAGDKGQYKA